jgi:hypothetical protein
MVEPVEVPDMAEEPAVEPQPAAEPAGEWPLPLEPEPVR